MKINLKRLKEIEASYCTLQTLPGDIRVSSELTTFTLQRMVKIVLEYSESRYVNAPENVRMAFETLKSLDVIEEEPSVIIQQLNS